MNQNPCNPPCPDCGHDCLDGPLQPLDSWKHNQPSWCESVGDLVEQLEGLRHDRCNLRASVQSVQQVGTSFTITLQVSANRGPVEVSLNRKNYVPGQVITGAVGQAVRVYVREVQLPKCETAVFVPLVPVSTCVKPDKPVVVITNNLCSPTTQPGSISLQSIPVGLVAYWYTNTTGTGASTTSAPAYKNDLSVTGTVRLARLDNPQCISDAVSFATAPVSCNCSVIGFAGTLLPDATAGVNYTRTIALTGTAPFNLGAVTKPGWMSVLIDGRNLIINGTPSAQDVVSARPISIEVKNCGSLSTTLTSSISVLSGCSAVESDWEVIGQNCRICTNEPVYRVVNIKCLTAGQLPPPADCTSTAPTYRVKAVRCVTTSDGTCTDRTEQFRVRSIHCKTIPDDTPPVVPVDPCAGVPAGYRVKYIHCQTV